MVLQNGRLPVSELGTIPGTSRRVQSALVPQTAALRAAFQAAFGKSLVVTDAYRTYDEQVALKKQKGVYAATPGKSNHGWGRAIDFGSGVNVEGSAEHRWMRENAPRFGWTHPRWASDGNPLNGQQEPWHWEATVVPVSNYIGSITGGVTAPDVTTPTPIEEDFMSALTDEEQRRLLAAADMLNTHFMTLKANGDRLPNVEYKADLTYAAAGNITNGVVALLGRNPSAVTASQLAAAIPDTIAAQVADELSKRLAR